MGSRLALIVGALLLFAQPTAAATVVNGDFETGTLAGWTKVEIPASGGSGGWFAYSGLNAPVSTKGTGTEKKPRVIPPPPQGNFAAIADQSSFPGTRILYQDIALEPGMTHVLSLTTYYNSAAPIAVPTPDTLSSKAFGNQQHRIDVMKPSAPIDSVNPADILSTVFRTYDGDLSFSAPLTRTVDLTPFGGQVVRLRVAEVDSLDYLNAGVDAVSIQSTPIPPSSFSFGRFKQNRKKGTATLKVAVPWAGKVMAVDSRTRIKRIATATASAAAAGTATLRLRPTYLVRERLESRRKLPFKLRITFTPTGGAAATQIFSGALKLRPGP
ncbi:MAG TPA: hypothetical protein VF093_02730 [Solirubrobacterales bacterium]